MIVELVGPPGAGKTTMLPATADALSRQTGLEALTADVALERTLARLAPPRLLGPLIGRRARRRRAILVDLPYGMAFVMSHPRLSMLVMRGILEARVGWGHRWTLFSRWAGVAARQRFLRRRATKFVVVFDEGLYHRAVNLFAWRDMRPDRPEATIAFDVYRYISLTPPPDLAIFIDVDEQVASDRVQRRGLPIRLQQRTGSEVRAFLRAATRIVRLVPAAAGDVRVIHIDNGSSLAAAEDSLNRELGAILSPPRRPAWPVAESSHWPVFRRPDRWWRARRREVATGERTELAHVAHSLGLGRVWRARSVGGGRSWSVIAETDCGVIVVKRYKPSVDDDAIRSEHGVLRRLHSLGLPAPRLVESAEGETVVRGPRGRYAAYRYLSGYVSAHQIVESPSSWRRRTHASGRVLGMLHDALADMNPPAGPKSGLNPDGSRADPSRAHAERLASWSAMDGKRLSGRLMELDEMLRGADLAATHIHGDFGPYNILVRPGRGLFVIDFELSRLDWRLVDLVTALPRFAVSRTGLSLARFDAFLDGYLDACPQQRRELAYAPAVLEFLSLRRASVCLLRHQQAPQARWMREARARIDTALSLAAGQHPMAPHFLRRAS